MENSSGSTGKTTLAQEINSDLSWMKATITVIVVMVYVWDMVSLLSVAGIHFIG